MIEFIKKTDCSGCPCLNRDCESGSDCNLGYEVDIEWTEDKKLIYCSSECKLTSVIYDDGEFTPDTKTGVIDLHPNRWEI